MLVNMLEKKELEWAMTSHWRKLRGARRNASKRAQTSQARLRYLFGQAVKRS